MKNAKINFLQRVEKSLSDFSFYKVIVQESVGKAIGYLILLSFILGIISIIKPLYEINEEMKEYEENIPDVIIKNGELNINTKMPIILNSDDSVIIIDTREGINKDIINDYNTGLLITRKQILFKNGFSIQEVYSFNEIKYAEFDKEKFKNFLFIFKLILMPIYGLGTVLSVIIGKLIGSLFVSLIGLIINEIYKANLRYKAIYKIGVYSMTLSSIIKVAINQLSFEIPFFYLLLLFIYYGVIIFYMIKAITEIKKEKEVNLS
ncbi:DUF1189 domain-containing protein [Defluviitalea phaphyphila]|uniref:DUF1189 domain-containing protein n=1 Tax=Defluviitalea phaphyphila TaxID=1473580 RepID=UPI000730F8B0|nr:DUF1189 domain-containing protein [Defluviitalea phaphyphila]